MARLFTAASSEYLTLSLGALGFNGVKTVAAICRVADDSVSRSILHAGVGTGTNFWRLYRRSTNSLRLQEDGITSTSPTITLTAADGWCLIAANKGSAGGTVRFHKYPYSAPGWTHENGATLADGLTPATSAEIGRMPSGVEFWNGDIALVGAWNSSLSDGQIEGLTTDLNSWWVVQPKGLWRFWQQDVTDAVGDLAGGGANQSARVGTAVSSDPSGVPEWTSTVIPVDATPARW